VFGKIPAAGDGCGDQALFILIDINGASAEDYNRVA
jgi:hypothetical protein